jgi:hypothetical protein
MQLHMRAPRLISLARTLAWIAGYGAAFMVAYAYASLPDELPFSYSRFAAKSMFAALRVPAINLLMIGLTDLLARGASRSLPEHRQAAERAGATLLCAAGVKAWLAAKELLSLPDADPRVRIAGVVTVVGGVALAAWFARPLWAPEAYRQLRWTRVELLLAGVLVLAIVGLNLPIAM